METVLDIPAPEAGDSETVVSSLETAAIFGAKGDVAEALRWLQRAAESSGESGDDARTLTLARTAASLSSRLNGAPELDGRRLPTPPARPSATPTAPTEQEDDAKPFLLESRTRPPPPSSRPAATSTPPPPPSVRSRPATAAPEKPSAASIPANAASKSVTPRPSAAGVARPSVTPSPPKTGLNGSANGSRPASKSVTPSVLGAPPAAAAAAKSAPPPEHGQESAPALTGRRARQAARVSVTRSLTERGLYFVRVLEEEQSLPDDSFEGLLVSNDPNQTLV